MKDTQHTPEKWEVYPTLTKTIVATLDDQGKPIHKICECDGNYVGQDNARRIVACVNACAGISTEMLELAGAEFWERTDGNFEALIAENAQLREENKQLATALSDAMKALIQP